MVRLQAQPYDLAARGFYFQTAEEFETNAKTNRNDCGDRVEEYEIQFIDGEDIDCHLAKAIGINQGNFSAFLDCVEAWDEWEKVNVIIHLGECGGAFDPGMSPDDLDVDIYLENSLKDLAIQFVEEGLFGKVPERFQNYIDYEAIAADLACDGYAETVIAGQSLIYRCT
ncbi:MAG: antirestriction protein ArdA [Pseudomonadota bacterium]